ncbi:hypothetical protein D3C73_1117110 [compost metagenome]
MIFFFSFLPSALERYQTILQARSLASEPEEVKCTFDIGTGAILTSISARSIDGPCVL